MRKLFFDGTPVLIESPLSLDLEGGFPPARLNKTARSYVSSVASL